MVQILISRKCNFPVKLPNFTAENIIFFAENIIPHLCSIYSEVNIHVFDINSKVLILIDYEIFSGPISKVQRHNPLPSERAFLLQITQSRVQGSCARNFLFAVPIRRSKKKFCKTFNSPQSFAMKAILVQGRGEEEKQK